MKKTGYLAEKQLIFIIINKCITKANLKPYNIPNRTLHVSSIDYKSMTSL